VVVVVGAGGAVVVVVVGAGAAVVVVVVTAGLGERRRAVSTPDAVGRQPARSMAASAKLLNNSFGFFGRRVTRSSLRRSVTGGGSTEAMGAYRSRLRAT
jgi:LmbE family N-acetylglucosaminyl deacetylase